VRIYVLSFLGVLAAVLGRWLLDPVLGDSLPLVTLFGAVAFAVWLGGTRPALLVALLGYLACSYLFIVPRRHLGWGESHNYVGAAAFAVTCGFIIAFGEAMRAAREKAFGRGGIRRTESLYSTSSRMPPYAPLGRARWNHRSRQSG
jgi:K+-sensing histidine kinase KdpD